MAKTTKATDVSPVEPVVSRKLDAYAALCGLISELQLLDAEQKTDLADDFLGDFEARALAADPDADLVQSMPVKGDAATCSTQIRVSTAMPVDLSMIEAFANANIPCRMLTVPATINKEFLKDTSKNATVIASLIKAIAEYNMRQSREEDRIPAEIIQAPTTELVPVEDAARRALRHGSPAARLILSKLAKVVIIKPSIPEAVGTKLLDGLNGDKVRDLLFPKAVAEPEPVPAPAAKKTRLRVVAGSDIVAGRAKPKLSDEVPPSPEKKVAGRRR